MKGAINASVAFIAALLATEASACDIRDFLVNDVTSIRQSAQTELAFVLTANESEFNKAKSAGGLDVFDLFSLNFNDAQSRAQQIAQSINFDSRSSYSSSYFSQTVDPTAIGAYEKCLDHNTPGMYIWLSDRKGDFFTFTAFWVGNDTTQQVGKYDKPLSVTPPAKIMNSPPQWQKGVEDNIIVQSDGKTGFLLMTTVSGKSGSYVVVQDPPSISWTTKSVISTQLLKASSHGPNPGCSGGFAKDCITPAHPGGAFVPGTAAMINSSSSDPSQYSQIFNINTPAQVCVTMTQSTGACEVTQSAQGQLSALEKYPVAGPQ